LIGGVVLITAHRVLLPKLPDRKRKSGRRDGRLSAISNRMLGDLPPRAQFAAGLATQLAGAAMLGAAYGMATEQVDTSRAGRYLIDAALVIGASLIAPELARKRRPRGRKARLRQRVIAPLTGPAIYGRTTSAALRMLAG
jgi:hypothetical protein